LEEVEMQWEKMTSHEFSQAVKRTTVCIMAIGVVEKHGDHLPLGTDFMNGHRIACLAAEKEEAVVFPPFYFGQIYEARCFPGTITIKPSLLLEIIRGMFDEIGRNGFRKIIVLNAHGGNWPLLQFLNQCSLWEEKPYCVYLYMPDEREEAKDIVESPQGHACEWETSISLANHSYLVKMDNVWDKPSEPLGRLNHLPHMHTGIGWYADYPQHYAGDARKATFEKGKVLLKVHVDSLSRFIAAVKADETVPTLNEEFFERARRITQRE
jgi:creatinine amidohydrolase